MLYSELSPELRIVFDHIIKTLGEPKVEEYLEEFRQSNRKTFLAMFRAEMTKLLERGIIRPVDYGNEYGLEIKVNGEWRRA